MIGKMTGGGKLGGGLESGDGTRSGETVEGIHSCSRKGRAALRGAVLTRPQGSLGVKRRTRDTLTKAPSRAAGRPVFLGGAGRGV